MSQKSISLLVVLAVLILAALAQYTAGGGWHTVSNEVDHEARLKAAEPLAFIEDQPQNKFPIYFYGRGAKVDISS